LVKRKIPNLIIDQTLKNGYLALSLDSNNSKFEHMKNDLQMRFELTLKKIEIDLYQHQMDDQSPQALLDQEL
jgi:hypothetical protein